MRIRIEPRGEEAIATIGADGKVTFNNPDHLTQLTEEDLLSLRLYLNGDAGNILWEYTLENLSIEPATIGYNNQTADTYYVTADDPKVEMKSALFGYAYRDESEKKPVRILWKAEGDGTFSPSAQTSTTLGIFDSTLTMSTVKGAKAKVSVELIDGDATGEWKTVEVLAGAPSRLQITKTGQAVSWQQGDVQLDVKVYDKYGNLVEDGTEVNFDVADSFLVKEQQLSTIDGHAFIILTGGEYSIDNSTISIQSGSVKSEENLSIQNLVVEIIAETTRLKRQQTTTVSAQVSTLSGRLVSNVPVSFSSGKGVFSHQHQLTNAAGIAKVQFTAGLNELDDVWTAQVGYAGAGELAYIVRAIGNSINALDTMLVADEIEAGEITYDQFGISTSIGYQTSATITINSSSATNISIGDMADPNLEPLLSLSMNVLTDSAGQQQFEGAHGLTSVDANNVTIVADHPLGAGRSANFIESAGALIPSNDRFNLLDNIGTPST